MQSETSNLHQTVLSVAFVEPIEMKPEIPFYTKLKLDEQSMEIDPLSSHIMTYREQEEVEQNRRTI